MVNGETKARIGVVASDPLRSMGLLAILEDMPGVVAVPLFFEGLANAPDITGLLLDMRAPLELILQVIGRLRRDRPAWKLIVMAGLMGREDVQAVIGAGAKGYLLETSGVSEIHMALGVVLDGSIWAPRKVLASLIEARSVSGAAGTGNQAVPLEPIEKLLTERELDVLSLLMNGRSNREIAAAMGIEQATVKAHLGRMLRKTRASNRVELTLRAMEERAARDPL
jgi:DNA-binding NarL/FixJ family response regulator